MESISQSHCQSQNQNWDQRIPNEPLLERQFLIERPPIIPQDFPRNTSQCTPAVYNNRPWLVMNRDSEGEMMDYWHYNVVNSNVKGVAVKDKNKDEQNLEKLTKKYPDRPWLHGIHRNIVRDSQLRNGNYNPKDYIYPCVQRELQGFNRVADSKIFHQMTKEQLFRNGALWDGRLWNESTSIRMNEPISFDYEQYLKSCKREAK